MKLSFICPVINEESKLPESLQNFVSFFQQFPAPIELIWFIDPSADRTLETATRLSLEGPHIQAKIPMEVKIFSSEKRLGRGPSILAAAGHTTGDVLLCNSVDFSIPMGDCFNLVGELLSSSPASTSVPPVASPAESSWDLVLGSRRSAKKRRRGEHPWARRVFEDIHHEKALRAGLNLDDPTTPVFVVRKKTFDQVIEKLRGEKIPDWFYTPKFLLAAQSLGLKIREIPVNCLDKDQSKFRWWKNL